MRDAEVQQEATRDIAAARAELRGRRDQATAEYDERLVQLDALAAQLDSSELSTKVVQDRVRQLLGERGGLARAARAGRTQIGMRLPANAAAAPTAAIRSGPPPSLAGSSLRQVQVAVDGRIVQLMMQSDGAREEVRLELAALGAMRRALDAHADSPPADTVLLGSVLDYADEVQATVDDLAAGGVDRLRRLLDFDRELASRLVALGGSITGIKDQLKQARLLLGAQDADLAQALAAALAAFSRLKQELDRRLPPAARSLFEELLG